MEQKGRTKIPDVQCEQRYADPFYIRRVQAVEADPVLFTTFYILASRSWAALTIIYMIDNHN